MKREERVNRCIGKRGGGRRELLRRKEKTHEEEEEEETRRVICHFGTRFFSIERSSSSFYVSCYSFFYR